MSDAASDARVDPDVGASASTEDDVETSEAFKVRPPTLSLAPPRPASPGFAHPPRALASLLPRRLTRGPPHRPRPHQTLLVRPPLRETIDLLRQRLRRRLRGAHPQT